MRLALHGKNKAGFTDGTCRRNDQKPDLQPQWDRCNAVVLSWIISSVNKDISNGLTFSESSYLIWEDLKERFDKKDGARIFGLQRAINNLTQGSMLVSQYYTKLKDLWDEYSIMVVLPACQCETPKEYGKIVQEQCLFQFLMGLNETYHQVRSYILLLSPLPSVNQAYVFVSQEEEQQSIGSTHPTSLGETAIMATRGGRNSRGGRSIGQGRNANTDECSYCH